MSFPSNFSGTHTRYTPLESALRFGTFAAQATGSKTVRDDKAAPVEYPNALVKVRRGINSKEEAYKEIQTLRSAGVIISPKFVRLAFPGLALENEKNKGGAGAEESGTGEKRCLGEKRAKILAAHVESTRSSTPARRPAAVVAPRIPEIPKPATARTTARAASESLPLALGAPGLADRIFHLPDDRKSSVTVKAPHWTSPDICDHIGQAVQKVDGKAITGNGHMRSSREPNAFPRSWSLEKILEVIQDVARKFQTEIGGDALERDSDGGCRVSGMHGDLRIALYFRRNAETGEDSLKSAYMDNTTLAVRAEDSDRDRANKILQVLQGDFAGVRAIEEIFENVFEEENIFSTIATAERVKDVLRALGPDKGAEQIAELDRILCLGQTRHPVHRAEIDSWK